MNEKLPFKDYLDMTQDEVAAALGLTRQTINLIEINAKRKIKNILEQRGITLDDLVGGME